MQQLQATIDILKARQEVLERVCSAQGSMLSVYALTEDQSLAEMERATNRMEVESLRRALLIQLNEHEAAMAVMQGRADDSERGMNTLGVTMMAIWDQLIGIQAQQRAVEDRLTNREAEAARKERALQIRQDSIAAKEEDFAIKTKEQSPILCYKYIQDAWAHFAVKSVERGLKSFEKALSLPGLDPPITAYILSCIGIGGLKFQRGCNSDDTTAMRIPDQQQQLPTPTPTEQGMNTCTTNGLQYFAKALEADPTNTLSWFLLGNFLSPTETVIVGNDVYTKQQCFIKALESDPTNSLAWYYIGCYGVPTEGVKGGNETYTTSQQCFIKALDTIPSDPILKNLMNDRFVSSVWRRLGQSMPPIEIATTVAVSLTSPETVMVGTKTYTSQQCYMKAFHTDPTAEAWHHLLNSVVTYPIEGMAVGTDIHSTKQCLAKTLESDPTNSLAWLVFAMMLEQQGEHEVSEMVGNETYTTSQQCFIKALETVPCDPAFGALNRSKITSRMWSSLACTLRKTKQGVVTVGTTKYNTQQCIVTALEMDHTNSKAWFDLSFTLKEGDVKVGVKAYTREQCIVQALEIDPTITNAWYGLGLLLAGTRNISVSNEKCTTTQCFIKALEIDPSRALVWRFLGLSMAPADVSVTVSTKAFTKQQCYLRALELDPTHAPTWRNLGECLPAGETVEVGTMMYNSELCLAKAGTLENADATNAAMSG